MAVEPYLTIESAGGLISSNEQATTGRGWSPAWLARAGPPLGLPPVDEGAGDGARYRGRRVLQRSLDVRFHIYGPNRVSLKADLDRVSQVLAHPCTLTWHDAEEQSWSLVAHRSGGGEYAYGDGEEDSTNGETYVDITVTFQSESPYWESTDPEYAYAGSSGSGAQPLRVNNPGSIDAYPVWTVTGPSLGFRIISQDNEEIWFTGLVDAGTTITIDAGEGTVRDNYGVSRYSDLAPLPRFFAIPPGESTVTVLLDQLSDEYDYTFVAPRHNFVSNPSSASTRLRGIPSGSPTTRRTSGSSRTRTPRT